MARPKLTTPHACGIPGCGTTFTKGGRASPDDPKLARCPMHYHRERRSSPHALEPGAVPAAASIRVHAYLSAETHARLMVAQEELCAPGPSAIIEQALLDFLARAEARSADRRKGTS